VFRVQIIHLLEYFRWHCC